MKRIIILIVLLLASIIAFSQTDSLTVKQLADRYMVRGYAQTASGFICEITALAFCVIVADAFHKEGDIFMLHNVPATTSEDIKRFKQGRVGWYCAIGALTVTGVTLQIIGSKHFKRGKLYLTGGGIGYVGTF